MSFRALFSMFTMLVISAALIFGLIATPTLAGTSKVTKGTDQLSKTDAAAAQVAERSTPMGLEEIEARSKGGLNEIQGAADADKMYKANPAEPGPAIGKKIEKALDKITK
jgi:hypothetical protein